MTTTMNEPATRQAAALPRLLPPAPEDLRRHLARSRHCRDPSLRLEHHIDRPVAHVVDPIEVGPKLLDLGSQARHIEDLADRLQALGFAEVIETGDKFISDIPNGCIYNSRAL